MRVRLCLICVAVLALAGSIGAQIGSQVQPYMGIRCNDVDAERATALKLPELRGVEVKEIVEGGPADHAGMKAGDVILAYNGETVLGAQQFVRLVRETPTGRRVKLEIWRNGKPETVAVTLAAAPATLFSVPSEPASFNERASAFMIEIPDPMVVWKNLMFGTEYESLDAQLAQYFGVRSGVLVRAVAKNSPADKAGIRAGDVLVAIEEHPVATPHDISSYLRMMHDTTKPISLSIVREHKQHTMQLVLPDIQR